MEASGRTSVCVYTCVGVKLAPREALGFDNFVGQNQLFAIRFEMLLSYAQTIIRVLCYARRILQRSLLVLDVVFFSHV